MFTSKIKITTDYLIQKFRVDTENFQRITPLTDSIGFSAFKFYNKELLSHLKVCVIDKFEDGRSPIYLSLSLVYDDEDQFGYSLYEHNEKESISLPINVESHNYFFINEDGSFEKYNRKKIPADLIIPEFYKLHVKPTKFVKGSLLRMKIKFNKFIKQGAILLYRLIKLILEIFSNKRFGYPEHPSLELEYYYHPNLKLIPIENKNNDLLVNFHGIKVRKSIIFIYAFIVLFIYTILYFTEFNSSYIKGLGKNSILMPLLLVMFYILFELVIEKIIPKLLIKLLNFLYVITQIKIKI